MLTLDPRPIQSCMSSRESYAIRDANGKAFGYLVDTRQPILGRIQVGTESPTLWRLLASAGLPNHWRTLDQARATIAAIAA